MKNGLQLCVALEFNLSIKCTEIHKEYPSLDEQSQAMHFGDRMIAAQVESLLKGCRFWERVLPFSMDVTGTGLELGFIFQSTVLVRLYERLLPPELGPESEHWSKGRKVFLELSPKEDGCWCRKRVPLGKIVSLSMPF